MRRILSSVLLLATLSAFFLCQAPAQAQSADRLRVAPGPVSVRENPSNGSPKVMTLKSGQRVRIDYEADGWVAVFPPEQKNRAESSALGYVRLSDLRLAGPLDLKRDAAGVAAKDEPKAPEKDTAKDSGKDADKKKADKAKTAAERRKEAAREAKAAKGVKEGKALKPTGKGAVLRDEMPTTPQQKATVRTASVVVEKPVDPEQRAAAKAALAEARSDARQEKAEAPAAAAPKAKPAAPATPPPAPPAPKEEDFGVIRMPDRPLAVRAARTKDSEFKKLLQPGQKVRTHFQADGFYAVFAPDERVKDIKRAWGYGRDKYLFTEKELAERGFYAPPGQPKPEAKPEANPEAKPEAKPEPKPEPKPAAPAASGAAPAAVPTVAPEVKKTAPQPEHKNATAPAPAPAPAPIQAQPQAERKPAQAPAPAAAEAAPAPAAGDEVLGYSLLERREDPLRPLAPVMLRVRLETAQAPAQETLRRVVREIWKAERRKADEVVLEVYLLGMDSTSLAYAVARFGPDGKIRELYWRESLAPRRR